MNRFWSQPACWLLAMALTGPGLACANDDPAGELKFERVVIDEDFSGAYQVEVADVNGDGKPDIVAVGGGICAWYENPGWKKRVITGPDRTADIITSVTADLEGKGKPIVAIGHDFAMENPKRGKLLWAAASAGGMGTWLTSPLGKIPSIHRLRAGDFDGDGRQELVVAPIFGAACHPPTETADPAEVVLRRAPRGLVGPWTGEAVGRDQVLHAIDVLDLDGDGRDDLLTAGNSGVIWHKREASGTWSSKVLVTGIAGTAPNRGASEVHVGKRAAGGRFLATIEPWHGSKVVVYPGLEGGAPTQFKTPIVLDDTLDVGHALWVADVDGDGTDEVFAGHRGKDARVSVYRFNGSDWTRTVIDREITAQDLRGGDLNGDGTPDIVAVGGASHNVVWYRPIRGH